MDVIDRSVTSSRAVLVANAPMVASEHLRRWAADSSLLIGVDGGANRLLDRGLKPTHVMGDFDSLTLSDRIMLDEMNTALVPLDDQNYTDLDKALNYTINRLRASEVIIFGATGGRLDHTVTALNMLVKYGRSARLRLIDSDAESFLVPDEVILADSGQIGRTLSLMPLGDVSGVWLTGVHWPLSDAHIGPGGRDGTSNIISADRVVIRCGHGHLLASLHHAKQVRNAI